MDEKDRLNALETALKNESTERKFYLEHARRTENPIGAGVPHVLLQAQGA